MLPVPPDELRSWAGPFADSHVFLRSGHETLALLTDLCALEPSLSILDVHSIIDVGGAMWHVAGCAELRR